MQISYPMNPKTTRKKSVKFNLTQILTQKNVLAEFSWLGMALMLNQSIGRVQCGFERFLSVLKYTPVFGREMCNIHAITLIKPLVNIYGKDKYPEPLFRFPNIRVGPLERNPKTLSLFH